MMINLLIDFSASSCVGSKSRPIIAENSFYDMNEVNIYAFLVELTQLENFSFSDFESSFEGSNPLRKYFHYANSLLEYLRSQLASLDPEFKKEQYQSSKVNKAENWKKILLAYHAAYDPRMSDTHALGHMFNQFDICSRQTGRERTKILHKLLDQNLLIRAIVDQVEKLFKEGLL